jgi:RND family efflux transporter MFP subunit
MFGVVDTRSLEADLHVPERFLDDLHPGQRCLLGTESRGSVAPVDARVLRVAPVVDAGSGTVKVVVALDAPAGDAGLRLRPGQFVRAQLVTRTHENATLVPKRAVVQDDGQPLVFVREGDLARAVPIETGLSDGEHVEVLRGLAPGAEVVVAGQAALSDGTRIQTAAEALAAREGAAETPSTTRGDSASEAGG